MSAIAPVSRVTAAFVAELNANFAFLDDRIAAFVSLEAYGAVGDGVTDDSDAFRAAVADDKAIMLTGGKTYVMRDVEVPPGSLCPGLFGIGGQARIVPALGATVTSNCLVIRKTSDFIVDGIFFDLPVSTDPVTAPVFNRALWFAPTGNTGTNWRVTNCRFSGGVNACLMQGITKNSRFSANYVTGTWGDGFAAQAVENLYVTDNIFENGGYATGASAPSGAIRVGYSLQAASSLNVFIQRNTIRSYCVAAGQSAIDCFSGSGRNFQITDNICEANGSGIELKTTQWALGTPDIYRNHLIANNLIRLLSEVGQGGTGVTLFYAAPVAINGKAGRTLVIGNMIAGINPPDDATSLYGVVIIGWDDVTISDNHVVNVNHGVVFGGAGEPDATAYRLVISNNSIISSGSVVATTGTAALHNLSVTNNPYLYATGTSNTFAFTCPIDGADISGNYIESVVGAVMDLRDLHNAHIGNNVIKAATSCIVFQGTVSDNVTIGGNRLMAAAGPAVSVGAGCTNIRIRNNDVDVPVGSSTVTGAGAFTAAGNTRGMAAADPDPAAGGALGDIFLDSTAATAGWRCTTAGAAGVAAYTVI